METVIENITIVFKNVRKKQQFLETFQNGYTVIPGTDIQLPLTNENKQELKAHAIALCDESIAALNEIKTAAGGGA